MSEWLVVLLGLLGVEPATAEPQPEATVAPVIELAVPELAGAERQFVRFTDDFTRVVVQRMIMRNDIGFAIADYRTWPDGYALEDPTWQPSRIFAIRAERHLRPSASGWSGDMEWRFIRASSQGLDCIALRKPVRLRDDPGNVARVVQADAVALLCMKPGMLTERDVRRVSEALRVNEPEHPVEPLTRTPPRLRRTYGFPPLAPGIEIGPRLRLPRSPG